MLVPLKIVSNVSRFKPALNLNRVLADLNGGLNSLNSTSGWFFHKRLYVSWFVSLVLMKFWNSQFVLKYLSKVKDYCHMFNGTPVSVIKKYNGLVHMKLNPFTCDLGVSKTWSVIMIIIHSAYKINFCRFLVFYKVLKSRSFLVF